MAMTNRTDADGAVAHPLPGGAVPARTSAGTAEVEAPDVRETSVARPPRRREIATDSTRLVSRTGALAFTLGLGIAVATNAGAAVADSDSNSPSADSSAHSNSTSSTGPAASGATGSPGSPPASDSDNDPPSGTVQVSGGAELTSAESGTAATTVGAGSPGSPSGSDSDNDPRDGTVQVSGGAVVTSGQSTTESSGDSDEPESSLPIAKRAKSNRLDTPVFTAAVTSASPDESTAAKTADVEHSEAQTLSIPQSAPEAAEPSEQSAAEVQAPEVAAISQPEDQGLVIVDPLAATAETVSAPVEAVMTISNAVAPVTAAADTPLAPPRDLTLWSLLGWVRREFERTFQNHNPVINYDPSTNSQGPGGVITGNLQVSDAEGDPVSYTLTDGPDNGTVTVGTDGTFTYTPSAALASTGGTDSFTVSVSDDTGPFHVHGLLAGLFGGQFADSSTMQINVSVAAPQAGVTVTRDAGVNRLDIIVDKSYSELRAAFEAAAPPLSQDIWDLVFAGEPNPEALEAATEANAPYGFIRYGTPLEYSYILNVLGFPPEERETVQYLMGNHMIATGMYVEDKSSQLYAPLKITIYADSDGKTHFVIDQPSSRFDSFDNPVIEATGILLDGKLADLLTAIGAPVPNQLLHPYV